MRKDVYIQGNKFEVQKPSKESASANLTEPGGGWQVVTIYQLESDHQLAIDELAKYIAGETDMDVETIEDEIAGGWHKQYGNLVMTFMDGPEYVWTESELEQFIDAE